MHIGLLEDNLHEIKNVFSGQNENIISRKMSVELTFITQLICTSRKHAYVINFEPFKLQFCIVKLGFTRV